METLVTIIASACGIVAFGAWVVATYSWFRLLASAKEGSRARLVFDPNWWLKSRIVDFVEPEGLVHHQRLTTAMFIFMVAVLIAIVVILLFVQSQPQI